MSKHSNYSVDYLQRTIGNHALQTGLHPPPMIFEFARIGIQPKLKVSQHDDIYEQEADRVAEQIMRMPISDSALPKITSKEEGIDRQCLDCEMEEEEKEEMEINRKPSTTSTSSLQITGETATQINNVLTAFGSPLDSSTERFFETALGHDFRNVRVHTNAGAEESAQAVNANAYTVGNNIVFNKGSYVPGTREGRRLIAHELIHVMQQSTMSRRNDIHENDKAAHYGKSKSWQVTNLVAHIGSDYSAFQDRPPVENISARGRSSRFEFTSLSDRLRNEPLVVQRAPIISEETSMRLDPYERLSTKELKKLAKTNPDAAESLRIRYRKMSNANLGRLARNGDAMAKSVLDQRIVENKPLKSIAKGTGRFSDPTVYDELVDDIKASRVESGIRRTGPSAINPNQVVEGGVVGAARTDVEGFETKNFVGKSPVAGGEINPSSKFPPETDPMKLPHTHGHAEQHIADQIDATFRKVPPEYLKGRTVWILIEQIPCSTCAQGIASPAEAGGVLIKLSKEYPEVTFEIKHLDSNKIIRLRDGLVVDASAPSPKKVLALPALPESKTFDEPSVHGSGKGSSGGWKGGLKSMGPKIGMFALPIVLGHLHSIAHEILVEEIKTEKGYAQYGPTGDTFHDIGTAILDPGLESDKSIPVSKRLDIAKWRANLRAISNSKKRGEYWELTWDTSVKSTPGSFTFYHIEKIKVKYHKRGDKYQWLPISGDVDDPPDLEIILDEKYSDDEVKEYLKLGEIHHGNVPT